MVLPSKKITSVAVAAVLVVGGASVVWWRHSENNKKLMATTAPVIKKESTTQPGVIVSTTDNTAPNPQDVKQSTTSGNATGTDVITPSGTFVSNHHLSLSAAAPADIISSVCRTNAGATCELSFTNGSDVKVLGPNVVGSDGTIDWEWRLKDIQLTTGTWQIQATAKLNDKTASTMDPIKLEISS